jgi:hypothetical protein
MRGLGEAHIMKLWGWLVILLIPALSGCLDDGALKVGSKAPSLRTKTLADVDGDFSRITTYRYPDKRMYQYSLDDALSTNKVIVLAFATPGRRAGRMLYREMDIELANLLKEGGAG